jgi:hypothetical protein
MSLQTPPNTIDGCESIPLCETRVGSQSAVSALFSWPKRILGPAPNLRELNFICWGLFLVGLVVPLCVVAISQKQAPDADFVYFYAMGRILNDHPAQALYDYDLEKRVCTEIHPLKDGQYGPIPYPPFVGILFRPFALLPFLAAYASWLAISLALYLAGLALVSARFFPEDPLRRSLIFCFALSCYPFVIDTMVNGQLSALGFFALALVLRAEEAGRPALTGLALSACLYKPTLLVLFLPMLLVRRRFKSLLGFALGGLILGLCTTVIEGTRVWSGYFELLLHFGRAAVGVQTHSFLRLRKYVDLTSFSSIAPGGRSWLGLILIYGYAGWAAVSLFICWWKSAAAGKRVSALFWATTITWTLLINAYVPRHDSILAVLSIVVTAGLLRYYPSQFIMRGFMPLVFLTLTFSWITDDLAATAGIQIITLLFAGLGTLQLAMLRKAVTREGPEATGESSDS